MRESVPRPAEQELLRLAREVAREMRPGQVERAPKRVDMRSSLERDLGLDSLGRAELVARLERAFAVRLPEEVLGSAETPADLARALAAAGVEGVGGAAASGAATGAVAAAGTEPAVAAVDEPGVPRPATGVAAVEGPAEAAPERTRSLVEVLEWHAERHPRRRHLLFYPGDGAPQELTYGDLLLRARRVAAGLGGAGVERGQAVALMLPSGHDYFVAFFGVLLAGGVPVPLYPPARRSQIEDHLRRQAAILNTSQAVALITFPEVMTVARLLRAQVLGLGRVVTVAELEASGAADDAGENWRVARERAGDGGGGPAAADVALLQFTSGSTGRPKGVVLTHANLLANLRALGQAVAIGPQDVVVSWLPLYHDMGLIGAWMASLYYGMPLVLMSPLGFLAHPARWLQLLSRHRGTLSAAPNFAYELCARKVADEELAGVDLSPWRFALNGAEPVSPEAIRRFTGRFRRYGFRPEAMAPVYGLAECSLALAIPPLGRRPVVDVVERDAFERSGRAVPVGAGSRGTDSTTPPAAAASAAPGGPDAVPDARELRFVGCGMPLPGHELRIVDAAGHEVGDRQEGSLHFRGPSATSGYFRDPEATRRLRRGEWLDSGDRAYTVGREVFITGRDKDIIIRAGRNLYPHELEAAVGGVAGIRKGCVAVFGVADRDTGTERLVVLAETRVTEEAERQRLRQAVQDAAVALLGEPADEVVLAPPHAVPKTSSGKVRRAASRELYQSGRLGQGGAAMSLQLARLALAGARVQVGRAGRAAWAPLYSAYVWTIFVLVGVPLWLAVALLPGLGRRRRLTRAAARLMFRCAGQPLRAGGLEHLAACAQRGAACLVAVNHASYLDAVALTAMLPPDFAYVAKRELEDDFLTRVMMRRLGALLVERFDAVQSAGEVPKAAAALAAGESLVIFPEGTFRREPGLRAFRLGGFLAAAQAGVPVFPAALRGTRHVFRDDAAIFRRGRVEVEVLPPISPDGDDWAAGLRLRDRVRAAMLERLERDGEPDLAAGAGSD